MLAVAIFGWALEPPDAPGGGHGDDHGPDDAHGDADQLTLRGPTSDEDADDASAEADSTKEVETVG